jgi:Uncharacterized protein conserved in bacteria (DUF2320).
MMERACRIASLLGLTLPLAISGAMAQELPAQWRQRPMDEKRAFVVFLSDQVLYDDNLFRLPSPEQREPGRAPIDDTEDYVNLLTFGMRSRMHMGRQTLTFAARANDVRFQRNDHLDYTGGIVRLDLAWQTGARLSGRVSGDYQRSLASYSNYRFFERDIVESVSGELQTRLALGPRLTLLADVRSRRTDHSDTDRRGENFRGDSATAGIELKLSDTDRVVFEYRYLEGDFPDTFAPGSPDARDRSYDERLAGVRVEYRLSAKLDFRGSVGDLRRTYAENSIADDYAGVVWKATLDWQPRRKLSFELSAWRDLKAYVDAESDYFEAVGASFGPTWKPSDKLAFALEYVREEQDYIAAFAPASDSSFRPTDRREDEIDIARLTTSYSPRELIEFDFALARIERASNRPTRAYDALAASFGVRVFFR